MTVIAFQRLFDRIVSSDQPVRANVYAELGAIILRACEKRMRDDLPDEAGAIVCRLVRAEVCGSASAVITYHLFRLIVLRAARLLPLNEADKYEMITCAIRALGDDLHARGEAVELLQRCERVRDESDPSSINQELLAVLELELRSRGEVVASEKVRLLFATIALRLAAVTRSWEDLHFWTTTANHWFGLSHDDSRRTKLFLLLELIEALSLQFDPDDDTALHRLTDESDRLFVG